MTFFSPHNATGRYFEDQHIEQITPAMGPPPLGLLQRLEKSKHFWDKEGTPGFDKRNFTSTEAMTRLMARVGPHTRNESQYFRCTSGRLGEETFSELKENDAVEARR